MYLFNFFYKKKYGFPETLSRIHDLVIFFSIQPSKIAGKPIFKVSKDPQWCREAVFIIAPHDKTSFLRCFRFF